LRALAHRLRGETIGDGSVARAIRELLATGHYRTALTAAVGSGAAVRKQAWHKTRSA
jgi:hypothetical protein